MASGDLDWLFQDCPDIAFLKRKVKEMASDKLLKKPEPFWTGPGYRHEYNCPHGVGHGNHIHGCDGCCRRDDFPLNKKNLAKTRAAEIRRGVGPFVVPTSCTILYGEEKETNDG